MARILQTAAEVDALPVGSVIFVDGVEAVKLRDGYQEEWAFEDRIYLESVDEFPVVLVIDPRKIREPARKRYND